MPATTIVSGLHQVSLGAVNAFILDAGELTLIDTGYEGSEAAILGALAGLGHQPADVRHIILTHLHPDHAGSAAPLHQATGAPVYAHPLDAALIREGRGMRPVVPGTGIPGIIGRFMAPPDATPIPPCPVEHEPEDGDELPIAGGLRVIHTPGHAAGHIALLWAAHGGVLIAGDVASNVAGLGSPIVYEDRAEGEAAQARLGNFAFEVAVFGHGGPIKRGASRKFARRFGGHA